MKARTTNSQHDSKGFGLNARIWVLTLALIAILQASAPAASTKEYEVKAAFLLNFTQFIQWPAAAFSKPDAPLTVGVLGDDPFGSVLDQMFDGEIAQGHKLVIKRSRQVDDLKSCQLLFICKSEKDRLAEILAELKDSTIVTVGEADEFSQHGGIINFYIEDKKVRFEINADAAESRGFKISSQLLKRAKIVGAEARKGTE
jgi:hypothetical protein